MTIELVGQGRYQTSTVTNGLQPVVKQVKFVKLAADRYLAEEFTDATGRGPAELTVQNMQIGASRPRSRDYILAN